MKQVGGVWLPDREQHLVEWMARANHKVDGKLTYQYGKLAAALKYVKRFRTAIDIGAHCGLWSMHLVKKFDAVVAFEPMTAHRECFKKNVPTDNALLMPYAVGKKAGTVAMQLEAASTGGTRVNPGKPGVVEMVVLDDLSVLATEPVDFIKLDCEGYELFALRGAEKLLRRCKPVVIVEQKPGRAQKYGLPETGAVTYLQGLGYTLRQAISGDYILSV